ncbi:hypothetical protein D3C71_1357150 [compost metagenome]
MLARADRVIQRHQAAAATGVHQERLVVGVEQQRLVAGQGQAAIRLGRCHEDLAGALQFVGRGQVNDRARGAQQPGQGHHHQQHGSPEQRAQAARGIGVQSELPPELVTVRNVLIGEQQQPDRRTEHAQAGHQVQRRERYFGQAAGAIERAAEYPEQARRQHHQAGFFPVEAFEQ